MLFIQRNSTKSTLLVRWFSSVHPPKLAGFSKDLEKVTNHQKLPTIMKQFQNITQHTSQNSLQKLEQKIPKPNTNFPPQRYAKKRLKPQKPVDSLRLRCFPPSWAGAPPAASRAPRPTRSRRRRRRRLVAPGKRNGLGVGEVGGGEKVKRCLRCSFPGF